MDINIEKMKTVPTDLDREAARLFDAAPGVAAVSIIDRPNDPGEEGRFRFRVLVRHDYDTIWHDEHSHGPTRGASMVAAMRAMKGVSK